MINLKVLVPEETTNYIKNPSFEAGTSGWTIKEASDSDNYYLYDKFLTDRIAGTIGGTNAEPVGGVRENFDSNNKFSISGGRLVNIVGSASYNGFRWPQQTRALGLTLLVESVVTTVGHHIGWDNPANTQAGVMYDGMAIAPTSLYAFVNQALIVVGTSAFSTSYTSAIVQRAAGNFHFIKGGVYTNWTLVYTSLVGAYNGKPRIASPAAGANNYDNIRVPKLLYIPVPLQSDGMSAATTDGLGNPESNGAVGNTYTNIGTWGVAAGTRACSVLSGGLGFSYLACSSSNVIIEAVCTRTAGATGLVARYADASNYLIAYHDGANARLDKVVAGVTTNLLTAVVAYSATAVMSLHLDGTAARLFYNNTAVGTVAVTPAAGILNHGLYTNNINATFDNLVIWARGNSETQYAGLDSFEFGPETESKSTDRARFGVASGKIVTDGSSMNEGAFYRVSWLQGISDVLTVSAYVRGNGKVRLRLTDGGSNSATSKAINLTDDRWQRLEATGRCSGSDDIRLYVETADSLPRAVTFYVDGAQMERKFEATTYCDGDQEGCRWNNVRNSTLSTRDANSRAGGRWVPIAGPCRPNNDLYVTVLGGFGMPPLTNNIQSWSNAPGSFFQNEKIQNRVVTLSFHVKREAFRTGGRAPSILALHELKQQLIDLIKPDLTLNSEAFLFEYSDSETDKKLYIRMRYEAGLEGDWDIRNQWFSSFPVRMLAVDPFWTEDTQDVLQLGTKETSGSIGAWARINGAWTPITNSAGSPIVDHVNCFAEASDGTIYIGGDFTTPTGITRICKWDGTTLTNLGNGGANDYVSAIAVGPDGMVYAVGEFTSIGGVAANGVAKYNPTTDTWAAMGTGFTHSVIPLGTAPTVCVAPNGQVYVGGNFTTVGGVTCYCIARWDGQWRTVGQFSGTSGPVTSIINAGDGRTLYVGGYFTEEQGGTGLTLGGVASVDINTNLFTQLGYGFGGLGAVTCLAVGLDGTLYAGGGFTQSGAPSAPALGVLKVAKYSGGQIWEQLGDGFEHSDTGRNAFVYSLHVGRKGELYAAGSFDLTGSRKLPSLAKWFGGNWNPVGFPSIYVGLYAGDVLVDVLETSEGILLVGGSLLSSVSYPKISTITNNGTASCWPLMSIQGQGTLRYIANIKTGQEIFLDLAIFSGESVTIDFAKGTVISSTRGNMSYTILPGSEIRAIYLLPGENQMSVLITDDVAASAQLRWELQDWSADSIIKAEEL